MSEIESPHPEEAHKSHRSNWLRASVLGVDDGVVSTASLMTGVATAHASPSAILTAGVAGLAAGALSMAVGEYVSVSSQKDSEEADIAIEERSLKNNPEGELDELAHIYVHRGVEPRLARKVAEQLHEHNAIAAHMRDELAMDIGELAKPWQAALASAVAFSFGSIFPILAAVIDKGRSKAWAIVIAALIILAISGAIGAIIGGGHRIRAASRILIGGGLAMAITALIGHLIGAAI